jgi:hypothetical protein
MSHVYKVGQLVRTRGRNADRTGGVYEVVRLMPPGPDGVPQYRVKGEGGGERVVHENELAKG